MLNYPNHALHVYRLNTDVNDHNSHMLNALAPKSQQYSIKARDSMAGQTDHQTCLTNNQRLVAFTVSLKQQFGPDLMLATDVEVEQFHVWVSCNCQYMYAIDPSFANQECVVIAKGLRFDF